MIDEAIKRHSKFYGVPGSLVKAIIMKESSFNPYAIKVERGFWSRYFAGVKNLILSTKSKRDDYWMNYSDLISASYGLMQIMLPVAVELGFTFIYPTELLDIDKNIDFGCRKLRVLFLKYENLADVISAYNQGNAKKNADGKYLNQQYVDDVLNFMKENEAEF